MQLLIITLFAFALLPAQSVKETISKTFQTYFQLLADKNYEKSTDYLAEEFFQIMPKKAVASMMKSTMDKEDMTISFIRCDVKSVDDIQVIDGKHYAVITYAGEMSMRFNTLKFDDSAQKKTWSEFTKSAFERQFSAPVNFDDGTNTFTFAPQKKALAISKNGTTDWKFIELEPKQKFFLKSILPEGS